jgi:hypothetical protein
MRTKKDKLINIKVFAVVALSMPMSWLEFEGVQGISVMAMNMDSGPDSRGV